MRRGEGLLDVARGQQPAMIREATMLRSQRLPWILALMIAAPLAGCATPRPDTDGTPGDARNLLLNVEHRDRLACQDKRRPDCIDWFVLNLLGEGEIQLEVTAVDGEGHTLDYAVTVANHRTDPLRHASNEGSREVLMSWSGDPGPYFVAVSSDAAQPPLRYDIVARYQRARPPEESPPRFETTSWMVLEVEAEGGQPRFVIIDGGRRNGLRKGLRGRLIEHGRFVAEIEIVDVFDEGSRARIATELADQITPQTAAEIDVPVGGSP
jgi:hypothetical protein